MKNKMAVTYRIQDEDAEEWARTFGWRDWFMFYVQNEQPGRNLFRVKGSGKLNIVGPRSVAAS